MRNFRAVGLCCGLFCGLRYTLRMIFTSHSIEETLNLGRAIGRLSPASAMTCVALDGPLGAGKTHLTRGIAEGAGVDDPTLVSSPTYVLLNIYAGPKPVFHLDAYRVASPEDFAAIGFEEILAGESPEAAAGGIVVVEWAMKVAELLPADRLEIGIEHAGDAETSERAFTITGTGEKSRELVAGLASAMQSH
jgi:tRNA threonylcarbamoyladenosine biosynthesis protein TsaE